MEYHDIKFLNSAAKVSQWPDTELPEIIFAGRSNAGKSSLINSLTNRKNVAYAGKTPGKTKLLNFFEVDGKVIFTDAWFHIITQNFEFMTMVAWFVCHCIKNPCIP